MEAFLASAAAESSLIVEPLKKSPVKKKPYTVSGKGDFSSINFEKQQETEHKKIYLGEEVILSCVFLYKNKAGIYMNLCKVLCSNLSASLPDVTKAKWTLKHIEIMCLYFLICKLQWNL